MPVGYGKSAILHVSDTTKNPARQAGDHDGCGTSKSTLYIYLQDATFV